MRIITTLLLSVVITGCGSWGGYKDPAPDSESFNVGKITVTTQNFDTGSERDANRVAAIEAATWFVWRIFHDDAFSEAFEGSELMASCDNGEMKVSGRELITDLRSLDLSVSIVAKKPWFAEGLTDPVKSRITVNPDRVDAFKGRDIFQGSKLVETLAHELAHMIPERKGHTLPKYRDRGHGTECPQDELASYVVGRMARAFYIHYLVTGNVEQL